MGTVVRDARASLAGGATSAVVWQRPQIGPGARSRTCSAETRLVLEVPPHRCSDRQAPAVLLQSPRNVGKHMLHGIANLQLPQGAQPEPCGGQHGCRFLQDKQYPSTVPPSHEQSELHRICKTRPQMQNLHVLNAKAFLTQLPCSTSDKLAGTDGKEVNLEKNHVVATETPNEKIDDEDLLTLIRDLDEFDARLAEDEVTLQTIAMQGTTLLEQFAASQNEAHQMQSHSI